MNICKKRTMALVLVTSMVTSYGVNCSAGFFSVLKGFFVRPKKISTSFFKSPKKIAGAVILGVVGIACIWSLFYLRNDANRRRRNAAFREEFLAACRDGNLEEAQRIARETAPHTFLENSDVRLFISRDGKPGENINLEIVQYLDRIFDLDENVTGPRGRALSGYSIMLRGACRNNNEELIGWLVREKHAVIGGDRLTGRPVLRDFLDSYPVESLRCLDENGYNFDDTFFKELLILFPLYGRYGCKYGEHSLDSLRWAFEEKDLSSIDALSGEISDALCTACSVGNVEFVQCWLDMGADTSIEGRAHKTPLQIAREGFVVEEERKERYRQIVALLEARG